MKRTIIASITVFMLILASGFVFDSGNSADKASMLPWFSVQILNGSSPVYGASVTISGPSGTSYHTSDANGMVCTSHNFGTVRVSWVGQRKDHFGCTDINHQSQTMCATNPYIVYCGSYCNEW